ncbi:tyrosine-type recombinase/integrase [Quadrisphaera sp. INWT6]|nr:tyrosine-type recombinase/integrase [Quadrisphaera sp. INWT6]
MGAYLAQDLRADDASTPLWLGGCPGGYSHGARGGTTSTDDSPVSGAVDYDRPWEPGTFVKRRFRPALVAAGLPSGTRGAGVRFHDLRHTYASLCASAGVRSQQVAEWMGHANDTVTRLIYTHLFAEDTAAAVAALEGLSARPAAPDPALAATASVTALRPTGTTGGSFAR